MDRHGSKTVKKAIRVCRKVLNSLAISDSHHQVRPGARLRDLRIQAGLRQVNLAETLGISASYLNLIEHDRRRIAGKLLVRAADALGVSPARLTEGADPDLVARMQTAAAGMDDPPDAASATDLATRAPRWAHLIAHQHRQIAALESQVQELGDRLHYDPDLASTLHDVISTATAIRSTAAILTEDETLDADWLARFHRNIHEDAIRLAVSSDRLIAKLDPQGREGQPSPPLEARRLPQADADAKALRTDPFLRAAREAGFDPARLAGLAPPAQLLRRLASLSVDEDAPKMGLVVCDGAGVVTHAAGVPGFDLARQGGACALWPVFTALGQPGRVVEATVELPGDPAKRLRCHAIAEARSPAHFGHPPVIEATMLVQFDPPEGPSAPLPIGLTCRICPRHACAARREPSVL